MGNQEVKRAFLDLANNLERLFKAVLPDRAALDFAMDVAPIHVIAEKIGALTPPAEIAEVLQQVEGLLDRSIATEGYVIREAPASYGEDHLVDLSGIDFEALARRFEKGRKKTLTEKLKGAVARKLQSMVRRNRTRMDYLERFQRMIDAYNLGSVNVEDFFKQLMDFAQSLDEEEQRSVGEQLSEEGLAVFDLLTRPEMELTNKEREQVKGTARALLETLKHEKLVLDWRKRQQARAEVRVTIEKVLDGGLPEAYTRDVFATKTTAVFQHVYDSYYGAGRSVYEAVA